MGDLRWVVTPKIDGHLKLLTINHGNGKIRTQTRPSCAVNNFLKGKEFE